MISLSFRGRWCPLVYAMIKTLTPGGTMSNSIINNYFRSAGHRNRGGKVTETRAGGG
uniref:Uncharacterized protein n=1 Tax=Escherichia coli TaxID=562 RepID=A0A7L8KA94_ECOLX|nr:hypothetical protein [Proteus vulgaris]QOE89766.1 hypothetical protein [Escherichia coli]UCK65669.1 hypothetical protein [Providencia rettgeri]